MLSYIIQFTNLDDFISELPLDHTVRFVALDITEGTYEKVSELRIAGIGVHVRAINGASHILACYLPVAQLQIFGRRTRKGDPAKETYNQAWDKAATLKAHVCTFLAKSGFPVRSGVNHFGDVNLLHGRWSSDPGRPGLSIQ